MKKYVLPIVLIILAVATAGSGVFLVVNFEEDPAYIAPLNRYEQITRQQLEGLKVHLQKYKEAHGRYPTNDEGLAALDNFEDEFDTVMYKGRDSRYSVPAPLYEHGHWGPWYWTEDAVDAYHGHADSPEEARKAFLAAIHPANEAELVERFKAVPVNVRLAIGANDNVYVRSPAGVLSPWFLPYVYENRNGIDADKFRDSPVNDDEKNRYSVRVDDGIYIHSVPGRYYADLQEEWLWEYNFPRFIGIGLIILAAILVVALICFSGKKTAIIGTAVVLASAGAGVVLKYVTCPMCYAISSYHFIERDYAMCVRQKELLDKYHSRGVINDDTYNKALSAMGIEPEPTSKPADGE